MMRALFLLILIAGIAAGIVYPWAIQNFSGREIGIWRVYDTAGGFRPATVPLTRDDAPVRVIVDLTSALRPATTGAETVLTVTASVAGRTVLAETLNFVDAAARDDSPQTVEKIYRDDAGVIAGIDDGEYRFVVGQGDADDIPMQAVDLELRGGAGVYDARAQPIGFTLMAIGFIGFVLSLRRGGGDGPQNPNSQPPPPKWGRGAGQA